MLYKSLSCAMQEQYVFKYFLGDLVKKAKSNGNSSGSSSSVDIDGAKVEKTKDTEFEEAVRDLKISWIGKSVIIYLCHGLLRKCFVFHFHSQYLSLKGKKVKFSHTRYRVLGPELIPVYRQRARR